MAGFKFEKNLIGAPGAGQETCLIAVSVTVTLGGLVRAIVAGNLTNNNGVVYEDSIAGETLSGICEGIVTKDGIPLDNADSSEFDGTRAGTSGLLGSETYAASADNTTDKQVSMLVRNLSVLDVIRGTADATLGTTAGSYTRGNYTDVISTALVDENNAGNALTTVAQLVIWGRVPGQTTEGFYIAKELLQENG